MPLCIVNQDIFYGTKQFAPHLFNSWMKKNAFAKPFHILLFTKWMLWAILGTSLFAFSIRFIQSDTPRLVLYAALGSLTCIFTISTLVVMSVDTTDQNARDISKRNKDYHKCAGIQVINSITNYCNICQVVVSKSTKHCKPCNKCTAEFDHHCVYMSTCIGKGNYTAFCVAIVTGTLLCIACASISFYGFALYFSDYASFCQRGMLVNFNYSCQVVVIFGFGSPSFYIGSEVALCLVAVLNTVISVSLLHLTAFHIRLCMFIQL